MPINGVVIAKLNTIDEYLRKLRQYLPVSFEEFESNWGLQKITERSLQVMIEAMIDTAARIISKNHLPPPDTSSKALLRLEELGVIREASKYVKMVRFRNLIVHDYASIDLRILYDILSNSLRDFEDFIEDARRYEKV